MKNKLQINFIELSSHIKDYVDITGFCQLLGMSKRNCQAWRDKGIIPFSQIGGKIYFKVSDIINLLETHKYHRNNEKL